MKETDRKTGKYIKKRKKERQKGRKGENER